MAADAREMYYERDKPRYLSFEIVKIAWSENFTYAEVTVRAMAPSILPMSAKPMEQQVKGIWRLQEGAWYWAPPKLRATDVLTSMFGVEGGDMPADGSGKILRVSPGAGNSLPDLNSTTAGPVLPSNMNLPGGMGRPESMQLAAQAAPSGNLRPDHDNVVLAPSSTEKVVFTNASQAPMSLFMLGKLDGIETSFDHAQIAPGEKAVVSIKAGPQARSGQLLVGVTETHEIISIPVYVKQ